MSFRIIDDAGEIEEDESSEDEEFDQEEHFYSLAKLQYEQQLRESPNDQKIRERYESLVANHTGSSVHKKRKTDQ